MTHNPQAAAERAAEQAEQAEQAGAIASLAKLVQAGTISIDGISPAKREAVRQHLARSPQVTTPQSFHARQSRERDKFFRELQAQGFKVHRASQQDHDYIFGSILDTVDAGAKPAVKPLLREYAEQRGYAPEWAERVAAKTQPRKMGRSLTAAINHPVVQDLKEGQMLSQTHRAMLRSATYSGLAELLFSGSQSTREKRAIQARLDALEAELSRVQVAAGKAHARLDLMEAGLDWKERARAILAAEPAISGRELARRVGKTEGAVRKYRAHLADHAAQGA